MKAEWGRKERGGEGEGKRAAEGKDRGGRQDRNKKIK